MEEITLSLIVRKKGWKGEEQLEAILQAQFQDCKLKPLQFSKVTSGATGDTVIQMIFSREQLNENDVWQICLLMQRFESLRIQRILMITSETLVLRILDLPEIDAYQKMGPVSFAYHAKTWFETKRNIRATTSVPRAVVSSFKV